MKCVWCGKPTLNEAGFNIGGDTGHFGLSFDEAIHTICLAEALKELLKEKKKKEEHAKKLEDAEAFLPNKKSD